MNNFQTFSKNNSRKQGLLLLLFIFSTPFIFESFGQSRFGVKASYENYMAPSSHTDYSADGFIYHNRINFLENKNGQALGLFFYKKLSFLFLQGDFLYNKYEGLYKVEFLAERGQTPDFVTEKFQNLDLAISAGYRFKNLDVGVGPIIHKKIDFESQLSQYSFFIDRTKNLSMGMQFSVGYNWGPFRLEAKMEDMFSKPGEHIGFKNGRRNKLDNKQNIFKLQFGIGF